jgi:hypothetical protein
VLACRADCPWDRGSSTTTRWSRVNSDSWCRNTSAGISQPGIRSSAGGSLGVSFRPGSRGRKPPPGDPESRKDSRRPSEVLKDRRRTLEGRDGTDRGDGSDAWASLNADPSAAATPRPKIDCDAERPVTEAGIRTREGSRETEDACKTEAACRTLRRVEEGLTMAGSLMLPYSHLSLDRRHPVRARPSWPSCTGCRSVRPEPRLRTCRPQSKWRCRVSRPRSPGRPASG